MTPTPIYSRTGYDRSCHVLRTLSPLGVYLYRVEVYSLRWGGGWQQVKWRAFTGLLNAKAFADRNVY